MAYILNIETSTKNCSVSIARDGETIVCNEIAEEGYSHAERLHVFIEASLKEVGIAFSDITAIAVSQGPGSYTGLRIGVSSAKGLCYALGIPLIAVDTLQILAAQARISNGLIIPMIDARRMEVYSTIFTSELINTRGTQTEILAENSFEDIEGPIYFVGDCAEKAQTVLTKENFIFLEEIVFPSANEMSALSFEKFKNNDTVDVAYFEPFYLKDFMVTTSKK
ncbi:tRNA (adenosine(37)-N6)-threonylcarbamoyltransferase complex dimerization subunit type 1 TsaB [Flavobacterium sp. XN-5]|uniref:tRNA (adenosine(37)-N6)-threonylcarbamoyltransferase complex dimerization subunit type 1 TsaB n=1 Tax=Flavobacterium sp. XN-5 TaxID=2599390 RepID=UPI0011CC799E|nr:tRNA (adenosine(37)-N6)-threonylcarbamoyltransferase complex dimerization subunit type 1 TsaB [Flavobacterium sp. XN-5]NGY36269.1 tRNA (adenosine(37)-N6)-threonylcarbamoyltransferase complex dimerization subunit type 1 TsaB [Flavobacterium sp. XN-5]